jgi:uncharacterized DUF497 family protein
MYTNTKRIVRDPSKAAKNLRDHKVSFEFAKDIFFDLYAIEAYDVEHSDAEDRFKILGRIGSKILIVVYVERSAEIRLISARHAIRIERKHYYENEKEQNDRF